MREKHSKKIREDVIEVYSQIAGEFDQTRKNLWHELLYFLEYVENDVKVLDLGCGNGRLVDLLKEKHVDYLGVDNSEALLKTARANYPNSKFQLGDLADSGLPSESFNVLFSIAAFHHLPGKKLRRQSVAEMHRVLKKDGVAIITVWNLFQWKYFKNLLSAFISFLLHLGTKYAWNDLWIRWKKNPVKRYYHAFLPGEFRSYFKNGKWKVEEFYFVRRGSRVKFFRSFNIVLIARKK